MIKDKREKINSIFTKLWKIFGGASFRIKIIGIVLGSSLLLSLLYIYQVRNEIYFVLDENSQEKGISIAQDIANRSVDLILHNDLFSLHELLFETKESYQDVRYVFVVDANGLVIAHTFGDGFPLDLAAVNKVPFKASNNIMFIDAIEEGVWDIAIPILDGGIGVARVGISDRGVIETLNLLTKQLILTLITILIGSLLASIALTWILTRPILTLVEATNKITQGDFSPRIDRWADDEIGDLGEAFNQMAIGLGKMEEINQEKEILKRNLLEAVIEAQEDERRRISRELHDSTSQSLTSLMIGLKNIEDRCDNPVVKSHIEKLKEETSSTLNEVHTLATQLRPAVLDDLGLSVAINRLIEESRDRYKINIDLMILLGDQRLIRSIETAIYRIVQEALANVAKHAGANTISVIIERKKNNVVAIIEDDGKGFDVIKSMKNGRLGILGISERAELLNGKVIIESDKGKGTSIFVKIPIEQKMEIVNGGASANINSR